MRSRIIDIVKEEGDIQGDVESINDLVEEGHLDSFSILMIVSRLEKEFGVKVEIGNDLTSKFNSISSIESLVSRK